MTVIECRQSEDRYTVTANGHAQGSPEACSGISAITNALMLYALNDTDHVTEISCMEEGPGRFCLSFTGDQCAASAWKMAALGLISISQAYPQQVSAAWI